jgi:DNA-binding MarR family transcriptional regulator
MSTQLLRDQESKAVAAWVRLLRGHASMRRAVSAQLQTEHGLTVNDYEALFLLSRADEGLKRIEVAGELQLTASGVTRLLDGLQREGLVGKATCATDARVTYAVITDAGTAKLREASDTHLAGIRALFEERYTKQELEQLAELLARLPGVGNADGADCGVD